MRADAQKKLLGDARIPQLRRPEFSVRSSPAKGNSSPGVMNRGIDGTQTLRTDKGGCPNPGISSSSLNKDNQQEEQSLDRDSRNPDSDRRTADKAPVTNPDVTRKDPIFIFTAAKRSVGDVVSPLSGLEDNASQVTRQSPGSGLPNGLPSSTAFLSFNAGGPGISVTQELSNGPTQPFDGPTVGDSYSSPAAQKNTKPIPSPRFVSSISGHPGADNNDQHHVSVTNWKRKARARVNVSHSVECKLGSIRKRQSVLETNLEDPVSSSKKGRTSNVGDSSSTSRTAAAAGQPRRAQ